MPGFPGTMSSLDSVFLAAVNLTILGSQYTLYSHVHHRFGLNDAFDRSVAHLLTAQQGLAADATVAEALEDSVHQKPLGQEDVASNVKQDSNHPEQDSEHPKQDPEHPGRHRLLLAAQPSQPMMHLSSRKALQDRALVEHPCLHEGYDQEYIWVAHGAHVTSLPDVQLLGRSAPTDVLRLNR